MNTNSEIRINFLKQNVAQANKLADDLKRFIEDASQEVSAEPIREDKETQDFGTILGIILGSAAITAVANGIRDWLARNQDVEIELRTKENILIAKNIRGKDAKELAKIITGQNVS